MVDDSSLEVGKSTGLELAPFEVDIAFKLDVKQFPASSGGIGHQLMLVVLDVNPRLKASPIEIHHLLDLGVLEFSTEDPDFDDDVICRVEDRRDYWVSTESVRQVWNALVKEVEYYAPLKIDPPYSDFTRSLRIAVAGMKYFNGFTSPEIVKMAPVYLSDGATESNDESNPPSGVLKLFR
ncbi:MAG: hypothetical protein GY854_34045 [Deltaproteobacteria bacterium]|nr:hypothetical protein [Deltaproteobacteria bacterium]